MKQQHANWFIKLFKKFANSDDDPEDVERGQDEFMGSQNMRNTSLDGHMGAISKIHGETSHWPNIDNSPAVTGCRSAGSGSPLPLTYFCIGSIQVLNHIVEFWADELGAGIPYIRIDGWIVCYPPLLSDFPISFSYPPQLDKNDSCVGGEVFYTDDHIPPFILNVSDMLENAGINPANNLRDGTYTPTAKYFCDFNIEDFQIQPPTQLDHPVFIEICSTGNTPNSVGQVISRGTDGMQTGSYQYGIQYVDSSGNTTNWSALTPQIPLPQSVSYSEPVYPSTKVYGGIAGSANITGNAIHIRFRVTNVFNYAGINIRRISWDAGAPLGSLGSLATDDSVIYSTTTGAISNGQISIIDFYDNDNKTLSPVTQAESTNNLSSIQAAKSLRYFQSRLALFNITYASQDLSKSTIAFDTTNGTMYPFVRPLGVQGYKDIWNDVYRKSYMRGEKYGFAFVGYDINGNQSFAIPIPGQNNNFPDSTINDTPYTNSFNNFCMPQRRDPLTGASLLASVEVYNSALNVLPLTQNCNSSDNITPTYEVYDLVGATMRDPSGASLNYTITPGGNIWNGSDAPVKVLGASDPYIPFRPTWDGDPANSFDYRYTVSVNDGSASDPSIGNGTAIGPVGPIGAPQIYSGFLPFQPQAFLPNLYALGMILQGVSGLPNYISAFAIVRTPPAGRVLAQGQGFYNISGGALGVRDSQGMMWDGPDMYASVDGINFSDLSRYKAQVTSPQGFFTEVFQGWSAYSYKVTNGIIITPTFPGVNDSEVDMISYARVPYDIAYVSGGVVQGNINPAYDKATMGANTNTLNGYTYTSFNSWRNAGNTVTANKEFVISSFTQTNPLDGSERAYATWGGSPRSTAYYLKMSSTIYSSPGSDGANYRDISAEAFHEPCYVTNIVDDTLNVTNNLTQNYLQTGAYVKATSIIGQYNAAQSVYYLVDERWQDCIPAERAIDPRGNANSFVYIQDSNSNQFAWLNVTYMTPTQISTIKTAIATDGYYTSSNCLGPVKVYGIYTHTIIPYTNGNLTSAGNKLYGISFSQGLTPDAGDYIIVKYDPCALIEVFGGDTFIGEYNYPVADCSYTNAGAPSSGADNFLVACPMPYRAFQYNENTWTVNSNNIDLPFEPKQIAFQAYNLIRSFNTSNFQLAMNIRQYIVNGIVEARTNMDLFFGEVTSGGSSMTANALFPNINYIQNPIRYNGTHDIASQYQTDYPSYWNNWGYGGFMRTEIFNYDYSESATADQSYSIPSSGFIEQLNYCSRGVWSDVRTTSEQNNPNLKNFPTTNVYDFDDATGGIVYAWDSSNAGQQGNLYAFTGHGVVMAETNKSILSSISGGQLAEIGGGNDEFIQAEVWLSRDKGMPDQMWRSAAQYSNTIYWADKADVYRLHDNKIDDLGQDLKYYKVIYPILQSIAPGYGSDVTAVWVDKYQEYWLCVNPHRQLLTTTVGNNVYLFATGSTPPPLITVLYVSQDSFVSVITSCNVLFYHVDNTVVNEFYVQNTLSTAITVYFTAGVPVSMPSGSVWRIFWNGTNWTYDTNPLNLCNDVIWADQVKGFNGQYKYRFDRYTTDNNGNIYGSRLGATFLLDDGYTMNGSNVAAWVLNSFNPKEGFQESKEYIRIRTSANYIPDAIYFFTTPENYNNGNVYCISQGYPNLKNYGSDDAPSWEGYIGRAINPPNHRFQNRYAIVQTFYAQPTEWFISSQAIQYKLLK